MKIVKVFAMAIVAVGLASCGGKKSDEQQPATQPDEGTAVVEYEIVEIDGVATPVDKDGNPVTLPEGTEIQTPDQTATETVGDKVKEATDAVVDKTKEVGEAVADKTKEVTENVVDKAKDVKDATVDKAKELTDKAKQEINKL